MKTQIITEWEDDGNKASLTIQQKGAGDGKTFEIEIYI